MCVCVCVCVYVRVCVLSCINRFLVSVVGFMLFFDLRASSLSSNQGFEPEWLYAGENFGKVLTTLLAVNFATQGKDFTTF